MISLFFCRTQTSAEFEYVDVWSSRYTWGDHDPPTEGSFVVIPSTMTILLDVVTPVLKMLLIQGKLSEGGKSFWVIGLSVGLPDPIQLSLMLQTLLHLDMLHNIIEHIHEHSYILFLFMAIV